MPSSARNCPVITGIGVVSPFGQGRDAFGQGLLLGRSEFKVMQRPGRQCNTQFIGAEMPAFDAPPSLPSRDLRTASLSAQAAVIALEEAWLDAQLDGVSRDRIGLVVGGSNCQQREITLAHDTYAGRLAYLRPTYGMTFMDTDICGICSARFGISGLMFTVGGASASGQVAILQAAQAVRSGQVDVCIALGALMDLSYWECQAFRAMGAMGSDRYAEDPSKASRPFDRSSDGFIFGENCGAVVVESAASAERAQGVPYATIRGTAFVADAQREPHPSLPGEMEVMQRALAQAELHPTAIDYVNPHGSGSPLGDATELEAILKCGLAHAHINATKSLIGHGLSAAGTVEVIATLLQMRAGQLHPTRNLDEPLRSELNWVRERAVQHSIENALTLSMGFGGINTCLCLTRWTN